MAAPREGDLPTFVYHRITIIYAGTVAALTGTVVGFNRAPISSVAIPVLGVLESDVLPGESVTVVVAGLCQVLTNSFINLGDAVTFDNSNRALGNIPGSQIFGRAMSTASAPGQKIQVLITREGTN